MMTAIVAMPKTARSVESAGLAADVTEVATAFAASPATCTSI